MVERIINPRPPKEKTNPPPPPVPVATPRLDRAQSAMPASPQENLSRARAIFDATEDEKPINPADFDFAMAEDAAAVRALPQTLGESGPTSGTNRARRILGMTVGQIAFLAGMALVLVCILAAFGYVIFRMS
jgi:hypothetical protein